MFNCGQDGESRDVLNPGEKMLEALQGDSWPTDGGQEIASLALPGHAFRVGGSASCGQDIGETYRDCLRELGWSRRAELQEFCDASIPQGMISEWARRYVARLAACGCVDSGCFDPPNAAASRLISAVADWLEAMLRTPPSDDRDAARCCQLGYLHAGMQFTPLRLQMALLELRGQVQRQFRIGVGGPAAQADGDESALAVRFELEAALIQEAFRTAQQQREQREQRLEALRQMAFEIAVELRSPLNMLMTSTYYLVREVPLRPEKLGEQLGRIRRQAEAAETTIRSLQDFATLPSGTPQPVDLAAQLKQAISEQNLPSDIDVIMHFDPALPEGCFDVEQMSVMMAHLIRNAKEAMPGGGTLRLILQSVGGKVRLLIADTGVGIAQQDLHRIIDPLFTTKKHAIGLGLAICEAVVQRHDGCLSVTSRVDWGSEFVVELPLEFASLQREELRCVPR